MAKNKNFVSCISKEKQDENLVPKDFIDILQNLTIIWIKLITNCSWLYSFSLSYGWSNLCNLNNWKWRGNSLFSTECFLSIYYACAHWSGCHRFPDLEQKHKSNYNRLHFLIYLLHILRSISTDSSLLQEWWINSIQKYFIHSNNIVTKHYVIN